MRWETNKKCVIYASQKHFCAFPWRYQNSCENKATKFFSASSLVTESHLGLPEVFPSWSQVASSVIPFINTHWLSSRTLEILIIKSLLYV